MKSLNKYELDWIKQREYELKPYIDDVKKLSAYNIEQFKLGDFLVAYDVSYDGKRYIRKNSYGAIKKYMVVHIDVLGLPWMKQLNRYGKTIGNVYTPIVGGNRWSNPPSNSYEVDPYTIWEIDPDFTDSIIMMDEENYDSTQQHRISGDLHKEIYEHNKKYRVRFQDPVDLAKYFNDNVKVGDVFYSSIKGYYTIVEIRKLQINNLEKEIRDLSFCKIQTNKGVVKYRTLYDMQFSAIYTQRPRSFNELKDPK